MLTGRQRPGPIGFDMPVDDDGHESVIVGTQADVRGQERVGVGELKRRWAANRGVLPSF